MAYDVVLCSEQKWRAIACHAMEGEENFSICGANTIPSMLASTGTKGFQKST